MKRSVRAAARESLRQAAVVCAFGVAAAQSPTFPLALAAQNDCPRLAFGADVSFLAQAESEGTVFRDHGGAADGLTILRRHGYGWVRLRLFNDPRNARPPLPNDLAYTLAEARRAKALGFALLLDFHYSDDWADPSHQTTPSAWRKLNHSQLVDAVYSYTRETIARFREQGTLPDMVQVGNEETAGILWPDGRLPDNWGNFLQLLAAAIRGVHDGSGTQRAPLIMLHIDKGGDIEATRWFFSHIVAAGIAFNVIGQSYYPWWEGSLQDLKDNLAFMAHEYHKPILIVETAYSWRPDNYQHKPGPFPETPQGQREFLQALTATVLATPDGLGRGVFWWEPAVGGPLARRGLFDANGDSLPALDLFNACMR